MSEDLWHGRYLDGRVPVPSPTTVRLGPMSLTIRVDGQEREWAYHEIRQTQGFSPNEPVRLEYGDEPAESLAIDDHGFLTAINEAGWAPQGRFDRPDLRRLKFFLSAMGLVIAIGTTAMLYVTALPLLADYVSRHIPIEWEERLGDTVSETLAPTGARVSDPACLEPMQEIVERLTAAIPDCPYTIRLAVVENDVVNAFAAPGGYVVVFTGLIDQAETPEEVAGVLAHELQHILQRHGTRAVVRELATGVVIAAISSGADGLETLLGAATQLTGLSYQRGDEDDADREGMDLLARAGIDGSGMIAFFEKLEGQAPDTPRFVSYLSTHPPTEDRIARLNSLRSASYITRPLLDESRWNALKSACR